MNVEPMPCSLVTRISPPRSRAISRLIERPRPVPPNLRVVDASACWNASKMIRCFSSGMPMPVSVTLKAMTDRRAIERLVSRRPAARRPSPCAASRRPSR